MSTDDPWRPTSQSIPTSLTADEAMVALTRPYMVATDTDVEGVHGDADDILCALLIHLGYDDIVQAWHAVRKWYA